MKYSLPARILTRNVLNQCDEIKIDFKDKDILIDFCKEMPDKQFVLSIPMEIQLDETELQRYLEITNNNLTLEFEKITDALQYKTVFPNLSYYWKYAPTDFYDLQSLKELGVSQILINSSLFFNLKEVKKQFSGKIRLIPNVAFDTMLPHKDGVCGVWVVPQDLDLYEDYVDIIEFGTKDISKQQILFKIYSQDKFYGSQMNALITNFNYSVLAASIPNELAERRLSCRRICAENRCKYCYNAIQFGKNATQEVMNEFLSDF